LSFRRFCGLPLEAETPDHASIWRFRQTIDKLGLSAALLLETNGNSMGSASSSSAARWRTQP
jgi:IS5 family transposase